MFHLAFDRALLPLTYHRPAFEPLFKLPSEWNRKHREPSPRIPARDYTAYPLRGGFAPSRLAAIHPLERPVPERRDPKFHQAFDRALLPMTYHRPAFAPLPKWPSEWNSRSALVVCALV